MSSLKSSFKKNNLSAGFTLMEIVVAMFIFTLAGMLIAEIFVNTQKAQRVTQDSQQSYTEARYLLDVITRNIRANRIDYGKYFSTPGEYDNLASPIHIYNSSSYLHLITPEGYSVSFRKTDSCESSSAGCVEIRRITNTSDSGWLRITSPSLSVEKLDFYPTPLRDPFPNTLINKPNSSATPDIQPQVTIVLKTRSALSKIQEAKLTYLQTTVVSRAYVR